MITIRILKALEEEIRIGAGMHPTLNKIKALIDEAHRRQSSYAAKYSSGPSYKTLVGWFSAACKDEGIRLVLPPNPAMSWVIKLVNRAKEMGIDEHITRTAVRAAKANYPRGPRGDGLYEFEWFIWGVSRLIHSNTEEASGGEKPTRVYTGRLEADAEPELSSNVRANKGDSEND